jgi:hypothetical protein
LPRKLLRGANGNELLHQFVAVRGHHILVEDQEVVDLVLVALFSRLEQPGHLTLCATMLSLPKLLCRPDGPAGADQTVAAT